MNFRVPALLLSTAIIGVRAFAPNGVGKNVSRRKVWLPSTRLHVSTAKSSSPPKTIDPKDIPTVMPEVMKFATGYFAGQALYSLIRLGIPNILGSQTLTTRDMIQQMPDEHKANVNEETLERILRYAAVTTPFYKLSATNANEYAFSLTTAGAVLQTNVKQQPYLGCLIEHFHEPGLYNAWGKLPDYAMGNTGTKEPFSAANGMPVFEWYHKHAETAGRPFNQAMAAFSQGLNDAIPDSYDWKQFEGKTLVDVGGSHGLVVGAIKGAFPKINCICMDLADVINTVPEDAKAQGVVYMAGDMFDPRTFPSCDVIYMRHILHDWSDENCIKILKSCHQVLPDDATVIVSDAILPSAAESLDDPVLTASLFMRDMVMLTVNGKERTSAQWEALADAGGFVMTDMKSPPPPTAPYITLKKK